MRLGGWVAAAERPLRHSKESFSLTVDGLRQNREGCGERNQRKECE